MRSRNLTRTKSKDEIAEAYASPPWWYDVRGFLILTFAYRSTLWAQVRFFGRNISQNHLEVAIGTATLLDIVLRWRAWQHLPAGRIVGIDYAESMLAGAIHRLAGRPCIELRHADVSALPYPDNSFDSANIANAVHCLPEVDSGLREVRRVLKPGATMAANVLLYARGPQPLRWMADRINAWGMRKGILFSPYDEQDIRRRIQLAGFEIVQEDTLGNTINFVARKPG